MEIRKLLEVQATIEGRRVPIDMDDENLNKHYSESKGEFINILDMDLIHLVRAYSKLCDLGKVSDRKVLKDILNDISNLSYKAREVLDE
jgi:hypothetical protein